LMKTTVLLSGFWRCWWSWFQLLSRTHGSDSPCLQNSYNAQSIPRGDSREYSPYANKPWHPYNLHLWHS
jgi:hypothetical protein